MESHCRHFVQLRQSLTWRLPEKRSPSPLRDHEPALHHQGSCTTPLNWQTSCSAAPKSGHLLGTVGKQSTTFRRKLWRNTDQLNIDSHGSVTDRINFQDGKKHMPAYQNKIQKPFQSSGCISMETRRLSRQKDFSFLINPPC